MKSFSQEIMKKKYLKHQTLGRCVVCPSNPVTQGPRDPAYFIGVCQILRAERVKTPKAKMTMLSY